MQNLDLTGQSTFRNNTYLQCRPVATCISDIWQHNRLIGERRSTFRTCNLANTNSYYCFPISQKRGLVHSFFHAFQKHVSISWPWNIGIFLTENEVESSSVAPLLLADWLTVRIFAFHFVHNASICMTVLHIKRPPPSHSTMQLCWTISWHQINRSEERRPVGQYVFNYWNMH